MFSYMMEYLSGGFNLPSLLLASLVIVGILLVTGRFHGLFRVLLVCFLLMSLPVIPKWMFIPLDIGILKLETSDLDMIDAIVVLTDGVRTDTESGYSDLSNGSEIRLSRALHLARPDQVPLFVSITDEAERERVKDFVGQDTPLILIGPSATTRSHIAHAAETLGPMGVKSIALFTIGSHAYRQRAALQSQGFEVPFVRVGEKDSLISWRDFIPSFKGYFYWQLMLKEYWGLLFYELKGEI